MAKKRKRSGAPKPASEKPASEQPATEPPPKSPAKLPKAKALPKRADDAPRPVFWFGYDVAWAKLLVARFVIFGLLAVDAVLQIGHAPRYGAGGFNVSHLPGFDALGPGRASFAVGELLVAYLLVLAALGVRTRIVLPIATALYGWLYFGSQLDSYQHHYLVWLVLLISCFVPWQRPADATPSTPVRTWAIRLLLVQLAIMYLWAAYSKIDPAWLDGRTLDRQISGAMRTLIDDTIGIKAASRFAVLTEIGLAITIWWRRAWFVALPVGVAFHIGILGSGLEIGLFAVLMLGFYVLVIPDRVFSWVGEHLVRLVGAPVAAIGRALSHWIIVLVGIGMGIAIALIVRLPSAVAVGFALAGMGAALIAYTRDRISATAFARAHLIAMLLWLIVDRASSTAVDYYRFWGGNARRLGDPIASEYAYRKLTEIAPDEPTGHYQLGRALLGRGEEAAGIDQLREAQRLEPSRARAFLAEAQWLQTKGRVDEAIAKAKEATYAEPTHPAAQKLVQTLTNAPPAEPGTPRALVRDKPDDEKDDD